eukprot:Blabericola_migrator_1__9570@NODE_521_length_7888_cov_123_152538_g398_i0_p9_GENE_NODE_521_length_7888_cov_123_152538_g398_i0NODE_521_length_7888_cov_123_152538_g398_i0_p9_ORF_typecomplete_len109_score13_30_NODE_521_length_7888_cov_123_152538_g398_i057456071
MESSKTVDVTEFKRARLATANQFLIELVREHGGVFSSCGTTNPKPSHRKRKAADEIAATWIEEAAKPLLGIFVDVRERRLISSLTGLIEETDIFVESRPLAVGAYRLT